MAKKVGQVAKAEKKNGGTKSKEAKKVAYAGGERNEKGLLIAAPADFDRKVHLPLSKKDFADTATYLEFRAMSMEKGIEKTVKAIADLRAKAEKLRKYGDDETRKKAIKLEKLRQQMRELEEYLQGKGVENA